MYFRIHLPSNHHSSKDLCVSPFCVISMETVSFFLFFFYKRSHTSTQRLQPVIWPDNSRATISSRCLTRTTFLPESLSSPSSWTSLPFCISPSLDFWSTSIWFKYRNVCYCVTASRSSGGSLFFLLLLLTCFFFNSPYFSSCSARTRPALTEQSLACSRQANIAAAKSLALCFCR